MLVRKTNKVRDNFYKIDNHLSVKVILGGIMTEFKIHYDLDSYVASKKLKLLKLGSAVSTLTTLWQGEVIMCQFDHLNNSIIKITTDLLLEPEDFEKLEVVIRNFFSNYPLTN